MLVFLQGDLTTVGPFWDQIVVSTQMRAYCKIFG